MFKLKDRLQFVPGIDSKATRLYSMAAKPHPCVHDDTRCSELNTLILSFDKYEKTFSPKIRLLLLADCI